MPVQAKVEKAPRKKREALEIRLSILEKDKDDAHTKHVHVRVTDADLCKEIVEALSEAGIDVDGADDAHMIEFPEPKKEEKK